MDCSTRDRYRHAIEELARGSGRSELDVAREAVLLATRSGLGAGRADDPHDARRDDPGYYLIADGRTALELAIGFRPPATRRVFRAYVASATAGYLGTIIVLSGLTLALPLLTVGASDDAGEPDPARASGRGSRLGPRDRAPESLGPGAAPAEGVASARVARGRALESADDDCRADPLDRSHRGRRADRAAGSALPGESGRRCSFRSSVRLDGCAHGERAR